MLHNGQKTGPVSILFHGLMSTEMCYLFSLNNIFLAPEDDFSDSFGDFIGGPSASMPTQPEPVQPPKDEVVITDDQPTVETNGNQSPRGVNQQQKVEKKGI